MNMEVDVVLTERAVREGQVQLRFFRWSQPTVTVGRTLPVEQGTAAAVLFGGARLVRRPTGGGVVFHADEMSLSLAWPRSASRLLGGLRDSYCRIHRAIRDALMDCGISCLQAECGQKPAGVMCQSSIVAGDVISPAGTKLAGGAQWLAKGAVLYQGHLWLRALSALEEALAHRLADCFGASPVRDGLTQEELCIAAERCHRWCDLARVNPAGAGPDSLRLGVGGSSASYDRREP